MSLYGFAASAGPGLGPISVAWAVDALGWRIAFWEMLALSGSAALFLSVAMPEVSPTLFTIPTERKADTLQTNPETILYRRAARLRRLTGNPNLRSEGEIIQSHLHPTEVLKEALLRPITLTFKEPIILGVNLYIGLIYSTLVSRIGLQTSWLTRAVCTPSLKVSLSFSTTVTDGTWVYQPYPFWESWLAKL